MSIQWNKCNRIGSRSYTCGHCGNPIASNEGYFGQYLEGKAIVQIYICHKCGKPTFFDRDGTQIPGELFGNSVNDAPDDVMKLYNEARRCISCACYTGSVLFSSGSGLSSQSGVRFLKQKKDCLLKNTSNTLQIMGISRLVVKIGWIILEIKAMMRPMK